MILISRHIHVNILLLEEQILFGRFIVFSATSIISKIVMKQKPEMVFFFHLRNMKESFNIDSTANVLYHCLRPGKQTVKIVHFKMICYIIMC